MVAGSWRALEPAVVDGQKRADGLPRARPLGWARGKPSATALEREARSIEQTILGWRWGAGEPSSQWMWWSRAFTDLSFNFTKTTLIKCYIISLQLESCNTLIIRNIFGEKERNQEIFWKFNRGTTVPRCSNHQLILYFIYIYKQVVYHVINVTLSLLDDCVPVS